MTLPRSVPPISGRPGPAPGHSTQALPGRPVAGRCPEFGCLWWEDCPSCAGGTARLPADFRVVHRPGGALIARCARCEGTGTICTAPT